MPDLKSFVLFTGFLALLLAASAQAQPRGPGRAASAASAPGAGMAMHGRSGSSYTHGWAMMSPQEREEHRKRMSDARTPEDCRAVRDEHRKRMEERAKERGAGKMRGPRRDACARMGRG